MKDQSSEKRSIKFILNKVLTNNSMVANLAADIIYSVMRPFPLF